MGWILERKFVDGAWQYVAVEEDAASSVGVVKFAKVTLDRAQIRTLPHTYVEVIPATETLDYAAPPTTLPIPIFASVIRYVEDEAYTNMLVEATETLPQLSLVYGSDFSFAAREAGSTASVVEFFARDTPGHFWLVLTGEGGLDNTVVWTLDSMLNDNGMYLALSSGAVGDLTGGGENDTLTVNVAYVDVDLTV